MNNKLKKLRTDEGISQETLAKELGVSKSCICAWEKGTRTPGADKLLLYIQLFKLDSDYFDDASFLQGSNVHTCFDMTVLNVKGAKKMYDLYLSLIENEEYLKKS